MDNLIKAFSICTNGLAYRAKEKPKYNLKAFLILLFVFVFFGGVAQALFLWLVTFHIIEILIKKYLPD